MKNYKLIVSSLLSALGVLVYTSLVVWILFNIEHFVKFPSMLGPIIFLLLFVLSATIVGLLVLGKPGYLYFNGNKREGIMALLYTIGWLFLITVLTFLGNVALQ